MFKCNKTFAFILLGASFMATPAIAQQQNNYPTTHLETRLSAVENQMRLLTGKVEQVDYAQRRMDQILSRMQEDYDLRFSELEKNTRKAVSIPAQSKALQENGDKSLPQAQAVSGSLGSMKMRDGQVTGGSIAPKAPALPEKPADYGLTPQEQYDHAFGLLRQADYDSAAAAFKKFFDKNSKHKLVSNAKYWYAETFYVRGKYGNAAVSFAEAYQHAPKGAKAPDSLLKLAMSLGALDKKKDACGALAALKAKYPKASKSIRKRAASEGRKLHCK